MGVECTCSSRENERRIVAHVHRLSGSQPEDDESWILTRIHAAENQQHAGRTKESKILYFCTLDIQQGYHNVELAEDAKLKTAFHAHAPLGVRRIEHLARTFQRRLMDRVLQGLDQKIAIAYVHTWRHRLRWHRAEWVLDRSQVNTEVIGRPVKG